MPTVAVLPFRNLSADPEGDIFADGVTEDVIAHLAKTRSPRVNRERCPVEADRLFSRNQLMDRAKMVWRLAGTARDSIDPGFEPVADVSNGMDECGLVRIRLELC